MLTPADPLPVGRLAPLSLLFVIATAPPVHAEEAALHSGLNPSRREFGLLPIISGGTDLGVGFGVMGTLAQFSPSAAPYRWRLSGQVFMTVRQGPSGPEFPFHDHNLRIDVPGLWNDRLRLNALVGFRQQSNVGYFGMGNASGGSELAGKAGPFAANHNEYLRTYPFAQLVGRYRITATQEFFAGSQLTLNRLEVYEGSLLQHDLTNGDAETRQLLQGTDDQVVLENMVGWLRDTRDHETSPTRGSFHEISLRGAAGALTGSASDYLGLNITLRAFRPLLGRKLVLAGRLMYDGLFGEPPFYELANHGGLVSRNAIGGAGAIRGVPPFRYYGKHKVMANAELRTQIVPFTIFDQRMNLGAVAFFDVGRTWNSIATRSPLDGRGLGLKFGVGGGLRLQWGETLVVRADLAWSPDADPVGFYLRVDHVF